MRIKIKNYDNQMKAGTADDSENYRRAKLKDIVQGAAYYVITDCYSSIYIRSLVDFTPFRGATINRYTDFFKKMIRQNQLFVKK